MCSVFKIHISTVIIDVAILVESNIWKKEHKIRG